MDYGVSCVGDPDTVFLDVRSDDEWTGAGGPRKQASRSRARSRAPGVG